MRVHYLHHNAPPLPYTLMAPCLINDRNNFSFSTYVLDHLVSFCYFVGFVVEPVALGQVFLLSTSGFPCWCHCTSAPYSYICLISSLYNIGSWQDLSVSHFILSLTSELAKAVSFKLLYPFIAKSALNRWIVERPSRSSARVSSPKLLNSFLLNTLLRNCTEHCGANLV